MALGEVLTTSEPTKAAKFRVMLEVPGADRDRAEHKVPFTLYIYIYMDIYGDRSKGIIYRVLYSIVVS